ncbi:NAD(P)-dependent oxidoreductase [Thioalkalivibrio denitrificans]|uniref:NAD(P)-dependent oxidoreductase n=1 Tax=Thioalkalivibrio denitrificans TaxID=108003 RepID=UPI00158CBF0E|nr:NAD(P)-dependent oxidoreductase [Thioalkalivibrio denitrificans]
MTLRFGYIGLGIMGRPMTLNLLRAGFSGTVWARRAERMEPLVAEGAQRSASPAELAASVDVVFVNVSDTPDVEEVLFGAHGVIQGAKPGLVVVDHSTISPTATMRMADRLAEKGVDMLDAPVSGGEQGAISGTLTIMVGGKAPVLDKVRPLLEAEGKTITHVGDHGAGQMAKACNQLIIAQTMMGIAEAFTMAEAAGVDPARVREALMGGFAYSKVLEVHAERMLNRVYKPGFKARLHKKDMAIALQTAADLGLPVPGTALATQLINAAVGQGRGEEDSAVVAEVQRLLAPKA